MRCLILLFSFCCLAIVNVVSQTSSGNTTSKTGKAGEPISVQGCITAGNGTFTLGTDTGDLYQLTGNDASLRRHNRQTARVTGTVTTSKPSWSPARVLSTQPPTIKVSKIEKVFGSCD